jgi:hypothetical protein
MSAREPITVDGIRRALIGVTPGDWNAVESSIKKGGTIVAPSGVVGGIRNPDDLAFLTRAPRFVEFLLAELDRVTATPEFADEVAEIEREMEGANGQR